MNNYRHRVSGRQRAKPAAMPDKSGLNTSGSTTESSQTVSSKTASSKTSSSKIRLPTFNDIEQETPFDIQLLFESNQPEAEAHSRATM